MPLQDRDFYAGQILGAREAQEDSVSCRFFEDDSILAIVADGMGGHEAGEIASRVVVDTTQSSFFNDLGSLTINHRLVTALFLANDKLNSLIRNRPNLEGMGCTVLAVTLSSDGLRWVSVGDSLLYLVRDRKIMRLNEDHSMVPLLDMAVKKGKLSPEQAASHRDRNALRSAVTGSQIDLVDVRDHPMFLKKNDVVLMASDGLLTLKDTEIIKIITHAKSRGAQAIVSGLLDAVVAKNNSKQDNTSVVAVCLYKNNSALSLVRQILQEKSTLVVGFLIGIVFSLILVLLVTYASSILSKIKDINTAFFNPSKDSALIPIPSESSNEGKEKKSESNSDQRS